MRAAAPALVSVGFAAALASGCHAGEGPVAAPLAAPAPAVAPGPSACERASSRLLGGLKRDLVLTVYATRDVPAVEPTLARIHGILERYGKISSGRVRHRIVDASTTLGRQGAKDVGLAEQPLVEATESPTAPSLQGYLGIALEYGSAKDTLRFLPPGTDVGLEFWIASKIRELVETNDDATHEIGVLTGKSEIRLSDTDLTPSTMGKYSVQGIISENFRFYRFREVDLQGGARAIPDDLEGLIVTQPGAELSERELRRIDQFVMKGKSLAIFASAVNVAHGDALLEATLNTWGLERLLAGYGVELREDVVLDFKAQFHVNAFTETGTARISFPQFPVLSDDGQRRLDTVFPPFFRLPEIVAPFASSLAIHPERQPGSSLRVVARTTERAVRRTEATQDLRPIQRWDPRGAESGQFAVAAVLEGERVRSAFAGSNDPDVAAPAESAHPARVFVLASAQLLTNPLARAGNTPLVQRDDTLDRLAGPYAQQGVTATILLFKNTLDWMRGDRDLASCAASAAEAAPLPMRATVVRPAARGADGPGAAPRPAECAEFRARVDECAPRLAPELLAKVRGLEQSVERASKRASDVELAVGLCRAALAALRDLPACR